MAVFDESGFVEWRASREECPRMTRRGRWVARGDKGGGLVREEEWRGESKWIVVVAEIS